jgi:hypothetical protein
VILLGRSARNKSCWMSWTMGQDDGAGLVRYNNSSTNLRVFPAHGLSLHCSRACAAETRSRHTRVASCRTAALGCISGAPLLLCSRINGPQPACAWSVALHTHALAETNRAGRQSCVARRTCITLLLPRPPHEWRELVVPGCTAALSHLLHQVLHIRPPRAVAQLLLPNSPRHIRYLCLREGRDLPALGPCLPLPSPRRPPTSSTRGPAAPVPIRLQPPHCSSSRTACDLPAHQLDHGLSSPSGDIAMRCTSSPCTSSLYTSLPCTAPPAAGPAFAPALPRHSCALLCSTTALWQNRLNYSGSSALMISIQLALIQCTSNGTIHWSVGSLPDTTTVQQD